MSFWSKLFRGPEIYQQEAAKAADTAWANVGGTYTDEFVHGSFTVTICACGSHEVLDREFFKRHGRHPVKGFGEGYFWAADGIAPGIDALTEAELWLVFKTLPKNRIVQKWAAGHEAMRLADLMYRLVTGNNFGDAGKTDRREYFE